MEGNPFFLIISARWIDLLALSILGLALGVARGAYGHQNVVMNSHVVGRMIKFGTLGFAASFLWTLALLVDNSYDVRSIPTGPVTNLLILIVLSIWSSEILDALISAANKVTMLVSEKLIARIPLLNGNSIKKK